MNLECLRNSRKGEDDQNIVNDIEVLKCLFYFLLKVIKFYVIKNFRIFQVLLYNNILFFKEYFFLRDLGKSRNVFYLIIILRDIEEYFYRQKVKF